MADSTEIQSVGEPFDLARRPEGVVIGALVGFGEDGLPLVDFPGNPKDDPVHARSAVVLSYEDIGREIALLFEKGDPSRPVLIGPIVKPQSQTVQKVVVDRDEERVELSADREIVLRCGEASITLTRAGKVLIRGAYVSSVSSGINKIKGGTVQIN